MAQVGINCVPLTRQCKGVSAHVADRALPRRGSERSGREPKDEPQRGDGDKTEQRGYSGRSRNARRGFGNVIDEHNAFLSPAV